MANKQKRKLETLKQRSEFDSLRSTGQVVKPVHWLLVSYQPNGLDRTRVAWTVSAKVGNAVIRNRIKRWAREFFRQTLLQVRAQSDSTHHATEPKSDQQNSSQQYDDRVHGHHYRHLDLNVILRPQPPGFYQALSSAELHRVLQKAWSTMQKRVAL